MRSYRLLSLGAPPSAKWYDKTAPYCLTNNEETLKAIIKARPALVILAANWVDYTFTDVKRGLLGFIREMQDGGVPRIVVMGQAPNWKSELPALLKEEIIRKSVIPKRLSHDLKRDIFTIDNDLSKAVTARGADYISILNNICPSRACPTMTPTGKLMSLDNSHFTRAGSMFVIKALSPFIRSALAVRPKH